MEVAAEPAGPGGSVLLTTVSGRYTSRPAKRCGAAVAAVVL